MRMNSGREADVQTYEAEVAQFEALLESARWNLKQTQIRAPRDGFAPHVALEEGTQVAPGVPVMSIVERDRYAIVMSVEQNYARQIRQGQPADIVLQLYPGTAFKAKVHRIFKFTKDGQIAPSGLGIDASAWSSEPYLVSLEFESDDPRLMDLPAGAFGTGAVYTSDMSSLGEVIRAVLLRIETWANYL